MKYTDYRIAFVEIAPGEDGEEIGSFISTTQPDFIEGQLVKLPTRIDDESEMDLKDFLSTDAPTHRIVHVDGNASVSIASYGMIDGRGEEPVSRTSIIICYVERLE